ncbi:MAG: hypothetical protein MUF21_10700 [Gemmatimonadaceae bacterium]|jgi:hypothetical protein|nr:hypothetical protein [Gemmatimonadaceae bacterium]
MPLLPAGLALLVLVRIAPHVVTPPDPCTFFTVAEVNALAKGGDAIRAEPSGGSGKERQCNWLRKGGDNVLNITVRESTDPAGDLAMTGRAWQGMYKQPPKPVAGVGDGASWGGRMEMLAFHKGKYFVNMSWGGSKYGGESSITAMAKTVAGKLR